MNAHVTLFDIVARLAAAVAAGVLIGWDRSRQGRIAGLRTTILMCLAATGAMIEANLMLSVTGKTAASFTMMDALRFPLGILSGIGFIGAGAIVRRGRLVTGVTTAACMWLITVIGLVLGAGYLGLGATLTVIAFIVLSAFKKAEEKLTREHYARLVLRLSGDGPSTEELQEIIRRAGFSISNFAITHAGGRRIKCGLAWRSNRAQTAPPDFVPVLAARAGVMEIGWHPSDSNPVE